MSPIAPIRLALALAVALVVAGGGPPATAGTLPSGFPAEIDLPDSVASVFLVGQEYEVDEDGRQRLVARSYELVQGVRSGRAIRRHFEILFRRLGWRGAFERGGQALTGHFADGGRVSVDIRLSPRSGRGEHLSLRVRVGIR